jgi:glycosyltransferase involved in cell wall biosynthesis
MKKLRVLIASIQMPYPPIGGGQSKFFYLLREVSKYHEVDLLLFPLHKPNSDDVERLRPYSNLIEIYPFKPNLHFLKKLSATLNPNPFPFIAYNEEPIQKKIQDVLGSKKYDLLHVEGCFLGYAIAGLKTPPRIIIPHDVFYKNYLENVKIAAWHKKPTLTLEFLKFYFREPSLYGYYDAVGMCTALEAHAITKLNRRLHVEVITNGVDPSEHTPNPNAEVYPSIVFSGSYEYPPNELAALRLIKSIAPPLRKKWPELKLFIIGNGPTQRMNRAAAHNFLDIVTGRVDVVSEWIAKGSLYCSPLRYGVGFKNKVPEAWAMKRPLVATPKTMEGIDFIPGRDALVAETDDDLIKACALLLDNPRLRESIGDNGRRRVDKQYNWPFIGTHLLKLYDRVTNHPQKRR